MDKLEKVERLRERANVSYEEAKAALDAAGGDLLDAMVLLERQGKTSGPDRSTYSTQYEEQKEYIPVEEKVREQEASAPTLGNSIGKVARTMIRFITRTSFHIDRREKHVFTMPTWTAALILLFTWHVSVPALLIAMLFGVRYSFSGDADTAAANELLGKAGSFADGMENGLHGKE